MDIADHHGRGMACGFAVTSRQVVEHDDRSPSSTKCLDGVAADVAGASCDQDAPHGRPIEKYVKPWARI